MMITFKKILVPTDFSKGAEVAYSAAQKLADTFGGKIDFLHVVPTVKYLNESLKRLGAPIDMNKDVYPKVFEEAEHKLKKGMQQYIKEKNMGEYKVITDRKPSDSIAEYASKNGYDLIVIGAKGAHESSFMRGSTTEKVIRKSKVPVFSLERRLNEHDIKNIVVPTDASKLSFAAFPMAVALADTFKAGVTLFHVIELYGKSSPVVDTSSKGELVAIYERLVDSLNNFLEEQGIDSMHIQRSGVVYEDEVVISDGDNSRSVQLDTKVLKGISAHYEIESYSSDHGDMLIMATHGHSGLAHLVLGSTAEKVAQYISKPVITVRPDKSLFE